MMFTVAIYECCECGAKGAKDRWINDPYIGLMCGECGEEVSYVEERPAKFVSVGIYTMSREYGGKEEGGWYYDTGYLLPETLRCFPACDFPQVEVYRELLLGRYDRGQYRVCTFTDNIKQFFPSQKPVYS
jgi:hypothetical protein